MKTAEEIKPCPFCNSAAELRGGGSSTYGRFWYSVGCEKCDVWIHDKEVWDGGKLDKNHPPMECVTVWNNRAIQSDAIESTVRECAEVVNQMGVGIDTIICHEKPNYKVYKYRGDPREAILSLIPQKEKKV